MRRWVEHFVIALNLCPFARGPFENGGLRLSVTAAESEELLLAALLTELQYLDEHVGVATSLLIHPHVLNDFSAYNQFLDRADALLDAGGYCGRYQVASFHPDYRFAGTEPAAAENYSNRSPYPLLHLLRESAVSEAVAGHPDIDSVPAINISLLQRLGTAEILRRLQGHGLNRDLNKNHNEGSTGPGKKRGR